MNSLGKVVVWALCFTGLLFTSLAADSEGFVLHEYLGRAWSNECVQFTLSRAQQKAATPGKALVGPDGTPRLYQIIPGATAKAPDRIAFFVTLHAFETNVYRFTDATSPAQTDLRIEETDGWVRFSNRRTGISLRKTLGKGDGPIEGVRLNSGAWVAGSRLNTDEPVTGYAVKIIARGPVMAEAVCTVSFGEKGSWESRYRLYANEPVVLVDEVSAVDAEAMFQIMLSEKFDADMLFFRNADFAYGKNLTWKIENGLVFDWEPWVRWHASVRRGSTFSLYSDRSPDLLTVAAGWAGAWVDPALPREKQAIAPLKVLKDEHGVHADLPLKHGQRKWMLGAFDRDECLAIMTDPKTELASPIPYRYLIKYGHFPLDMIKDYVLSWPSKLKHPCLLMTKKDVARFQAGVKELAPYQRQVEAFLDYTPGGRGKDLNIHNMDDAIPAYLATQDSRMAELMAKKAVDMFQYLVDYLIDQEGLPFGAAPHGTQSMATAPGLADIIYDSPETTPETRTRLRALAAFLGYTTARPDYWSPERGYSANPNMTTSVYNYQAALAAFISDHPCAKAWVKKGLDELKVQLDTWSDDNGGWLEAPSYALLSYDSILAPLVMAHNAGFNDWLYTDPKVKTVIRWFAKIDGPPDSRIGGFRHRPAVGNTYLNEPNGEFGILAYLFREKDPSFSAEMEWQFKQNNMYIKSCVGGFLPAFAGYRQILTDPTLPVKVPHYGSELFPKTGLVLRDAYPSDRETYLHMILGDNHAHYDDDSGSLILYGKGRILADDFGYYGYAPPEDHSLLDSPLAGRGAILYVSDFFTSPRFDYAAGRKGAWTRQIAFVKGGSNAEPAYFVLNDALVTNGAAVWRLWLTAQDVKLGSQTAQVAGKEDVDMDIFFLSPVGIPLEVESKTRTSGSGMYTNWTWGPMTTTQLGLIATMTNSLGCSVVLYPRLKTTPPATFTVLAGGKGVKVEHEAGTDYVFLSRTPFVYDEGDIHFEGLAGMIQLRGKETFLSMGADGKASARGKTATFDKIGRSQAP